MDRVRRPPRLFVLCILGWPACTSAPEGTLADASGSDGSATGHSDSVASNDADASDGSQTSSLTSDASGSTSAGDDTSESTSGSPSESSSGASSGSDATSSGSSCGDDMVEGREACDGMDLGGQSCATQGFDAGTLACATDCTDFDTSACVAFTGDCCSAHGEVGCENTACAVAVCAQDPSCCSIAWGPQCAGLATGLDACLDVGGSCPASPFCGDGAANGIELCDAIDLAGEDCTTQGFGGGTLACDPDCMGFDTSTCVANVCGNGVLEGSETCDGTDVGGLTCAGAGFLAGGPLGCAANCSAFDTTNCISTWWGDDFESGALGPHWTASGSVNWSAIMDGRPGDAFAAQSGNIADAQFSSMMVSVNFVVSGSVSFSYRVGSEADFDFLRFYIDGIEQGAWSGVIPWSTSQTFDIAAGLHTLQWTYAKDATISVDADAAWIDDIVTVGGLVQ